jgi:hypothetical protein
LILADKTAKAAVTPVRQRTQYSCMSTSMMMCLQANGVECDEKEVNKVMGARPMKGATWESALACAQHYGMRATLTTPSTVKQLKAWTDQGIPVMIAWNPEGRDWSHASVVFDVTTADDGSLHVHVADPNLPNPDKTTRVVTEDDFYGKWYEKWPDYLVRRPACAIEQEITPGGRQVMASVRTASVADRWMSQSTAEQQKQITIAGGRSPNQSGSSVMLKRQGLTPVDSMFGEALPHRRSIIMQGEQVQDKRGTLWFFVGTDAKGKAILAKTEREMQSLMDQLVEDRRHHNVAAKRKTRTEEVREKKDPNAPVKGKARKQRSGPARDLAEGRVNIRSGPHVNKPQRGKGQKGKGKTQRHQKHKQDLRQQARAASVEWVVSAFLSKRADMASGRLDRGLKSKINSALRKGGLDGNGRFRKSSQAYSKAVDILDDHGIELDTVVSSHLFNGPSGSMQVDVAFTNESDRFSPISITNSVLYLQFTELRDGVFEAVAYMS